MEEVNDDVLQTLLTHIQTAAWRDGVPVAILVKMLAELPTGTRGPFPATRETIESVVRRFPSALFIDAYDKVHILSKDCQVSTGATAKYTPPANKQLDNITRFCNVKGRMTEVMSGYGFAMMEHPIKSRVFVHNVYVEHGRPNDPNRLGLLVGDVIIMDVEENGAFSTAPFDAVRVRLLEAAPQPVQDLRPTTVVSRAKVVASDATHAKQLAATWPVCTAVPTTTVPCENNKEQLSKQVGVIQSLDRDSGVITFGSGGAERAFFSRSSISKMLVRATEAVCEVFKVGDKVCLDVQRNRNPKRQEKWEATLVTTVLHDARSVVFEDYTAPPRPAVKNRVPEISLQPTTAMSVASSIGDKSCVGAQQHFLGKQEKSQVAMANTAQRGGSSNVCSVPTRSAAAMEEEKNKMPCTNARKKCTRRLDQCVSVAFSGRRKLSSYSGTLHAESKTLGHVKCRCDGTIVLALIDVVYYHGKKIEHFCEFLGKPAFEEEVDVFVDAVEAERDFWLATLVWAGERPAIPHVNRSEDIFSSVLDSVRNGELAKGDSPTSLRHSLDACQRCHSTSAYDAMHAGSWNKSPVQTEGRPMTVGQVQEPSGCPPTAYPSSDTKIVHSGVASSCWKPNTAVQPDHGRLPEEADFTIIDDMVHPALVDIAMPSIAATSETMAFQGSISASLSDASTGQPAACSNMSRTRQMEASSPHEDNTTDMRGNKDAECHQLDEGTMQWLSAAIRDGIRGVVYEELHEALEKINYVQVPERVDFAAARNAMRPAPVGVAASRTAATYGTTAFQGSTSAGFADASSGLLATRSDAPGTRQAAASSRRDADTEYRNLDGKTIEWLSAAVRDGLEGIVREELREALQKLWLKEG